MSDHKTRPDRVMQSLPAENTMSCHGCDYKPSPKKCQEFCDSLANVKHGMWVCGRKIWRRIG